MIRMRIVQKTEVVLIWWCQQGLEEEECSPAGWVIFFGLGEWRFIIQMASISAFTSWCASVSKRALEMGLQILVTGIWTNVRLRTGIRYPPHIPPPPFRTLSKKNSGISGCLDFKFCFIILASNSKAFFNWCTLLSIYTCFLCVQHRFSCYVSHLRVFFFVLNIISFTDASIIKVTRTSITNHVIGEDCCHRTSR